MQYNVAEGNGADTTGNLPVSEEAALVAEVVGCRRRGVLVELRGSGGSLPFPRRPASSKAVVASPGFPQLSLNAGTEQVEMSHERPVSPVCGLGAAARTREGVGKWVRGHSKAWGSLASRGHAALRGGQQALVKSSRKETAA